MENKIFPTIRTIQRSNRKIAEIVAWIPRIHDSLHSWLSTDTSIKIVAWIPRIHDSLISWLGTDTSIKIVAWIPRIHDSLLS
jgi:hypothetical protein